ncbi:GDSL esterase/lipase [Striga hermonthica]|uniref:GDSL esterase/lipase n=1 Tax=Striga hermonthica TaxID=68872 RepID=A0A9N7RQU8_STRHE|nr:GDSL esterase/lipase [Striga hermonthica]
MAFVLTSPSVAFFLVVVANLQRSFLGAPQVPCFFIFGDSLVDNGNNNPLQTEARVNYRPYGVDFPDGPTGRFTNGRNIADFLAQLLSFDTYIPPFSTAQNNNNISRGVNYASGSAGIRGETGQQLGERISLDRQLENHNSIISRISHSLGNSTLAEEHLRKCLYYFVVGSNDYINNYYVPEYYPTSRIYTPEEYASVLITQYSQQLRTIYRDGARKVAVSGLGLLGCIPQETGRGTNGSACVGPINDAVQLFNVKLEKLVKELNRNLTGAEFVFVGAIVLEPQELIGLGVSLLNKPCCQVSNSTGLCIEGLRPCPVRALHAFYDNFHPTEVINQLVATAVYSEILILIH